MGSELDLEQMEREEHASTDPRSPQEVEAVVTMVRLELYNRGQPCVAPKHFAQGCRNITA